MLVALLAPFASAEEPNKSDDPVRSTTTNPPYFRSYASEAGGYGGRGGYYASEAGEYGGRGGIAWYGMESDTRGTQQLVDRWKAAKEPSERDEVEKALRESLTTEFTQRLAAHEREIKELEEKVHSFVTGSACAREKQEEIVEHRLQQILREAQGLGWGAEGMGMQDRYGNSTLTRRGYATSATRTTQPAPSAFAHGYKRLRE